MLEFMENFSVFAVQNGVQSSNFLTMESAGLSNCLSWSPQLLESPGFFVTFSGPGKSLKMIMVLESLGNLSSRSCKVPEFAGTLTQ